MRAIANCGWSCYAALTVQAEELLRTNENIHGERAASEPQDRVTELIEQQTTISEVQRAIANSPHDLQPIFDAILDSAPKKAAFVSWRCEGTPFWLVSQRSQKRGAARRLPTHIPDLSALESDLRDATCGRRTTRQRTTSAC